MKVLLGDRTVMEPAYLSFLCGYLAVSCFPSLEFLAPLRRSHCSRTGLGVCFLSSDWFKCLYWLRLKRQSTLHVAAKRDDGQLFGPNPLCLGDNQVHQTKPIKRNMRFGNLIRVTISPAIQYTFRKMPLFSGTGRFANIEVAHKLNQ